MKKQFLTIGKFDPKQEHVLSKPFNQIIQVFSLKNTWIDKIYINCWTLKYKYKVYSPKREPTNIRENLRTKEILDSLDYIQETNSVI